MQEGLIAYYPFNGTANDLSGLSNHGNDNIEYDIGRDGVANNSYAVNDSSIFKAIVDEHPKGEVSVTYSMWVKLNSYKSGFGQLINVGLAGDWNKRVGFGLSYDSLNYVGESNDYFFGNEVETGQWIHLVLVKSGVNLSMYSNGQKINDGVAASGQNILSNEVSVGWNGNLSHGGGEMVDASIDDVRVYTVS